MALMFGELDGTKVLSNFLCHENLLIQTNSSAALLLISSYRGKLQTIIYESGAFPHFIKQLTSPVEKIVMHTCDTLQNLCIDNESNRRAFCAENAPKTIIEKITSSALNNPIRIILLQTLQTICSHSEEIQQAFREAGAIEFAIEILNDGSQVGPNDIQTCEYASAILRILAIRNGIFSFYLFCRIVINIYN